MGNKEYRLHVSGPEFDGLVGWGADFFSKKYEVDGNVLPVVTRLPDGRSFSTIADAREYMAQFPSIRFADMSTTPDDNEPAPGETVAWCTERS